MLTLAAARTLVADLVEPDADPVLDATANGDIDKALVRTQLAATWLPSTPYSVGTRVVPVTPEGRAFVCVLAGTSDTTEPAWLIAPQYTGAVNPLGAWWGIGVVPFIENVAATPWFWGLADGTCAWRYGEPFAGEIYDVRSAAAECWRRKARKCATRVDSSIAGAVSARESQMYQMCMDMARSLTPMRIV